MWALEFNKPIIMLQMQDDRFWPWDYGRWKADRCEKVPGAWPQQWKQGWLQSTYADCDERIVRPVHPYSPRAAPPPAWPQRQPLRPLA